MANKIHLVVETAGGVAFERDVRYVNLPVEGGSVGVLAGHAAMLCALCEGTVRCSDDSGESFGVKTGHGAAQVENNTVTVLVSSAQTQDN